MSNTIRKHRRIIFNGDGYTDAWLEEAARRGLPNAPTTMEALGALTRPANVALFEKYGVFGGRELASRHEVFVEDYIRRVTIESDIALEIAESMVAPAAAAEFGKITSALAAAQQSGIKCGVSALKKQAEQLGKALDELTARTEALRSARNTGYKKILVSLTELREVVDHLETILPDETWPLPKYREMLFIY